jgi:hypothetical protein
MEKEVSFWMWLFQAFCLIVVVGFAASIVFLGGNIIFRWAERRGWLD